MESLLRIIHWMQSKTKDTKMWQDPQITFYLFFLHSAIPNTHLIPGTGNINWQYQCLPLGIYILPKIVYIKSFTLKSHVEFIFSVFIFINEFTQLVKNPPAMWKT